jgi:hypothetical protein
VHRIKHIAITAEDPFATAELFKQAFGLDELSRGDSDLAREVYLNDGHINVAIVCWKQTRENPNPYPEGYGLDHFGFQVEDLAAAEARAGAAGATPQPPPKVDLAKLGGHVFFERKVMLAGVKFDLAEEGWPGFRIHSWMTCGFLGPGVHISLSRAGDTSQLVTVRGRPRCTESGCVVPP